MQVLDIGPILSTELLYNASVFDSDVKTKYILPNHRNDVGS